MTSFTDWYTSADERVRVNIDISSATKGRLEAARESVGFPGSRAEFIGRTLEYLLAKADKSDDGDDTEDEDEDEPAPRRRSSRSRSTAKADKSDDGDDTEDEDEDEPAPRRRSSRSRSTAKADKSDDGDDTPRAGAGRRPRPRASEVPVDDQSDEDWDD